MKDDEEFNVYNEENREELVDAGEIEPEEDGFMQGYNEESDPSKCANCGKTLVRDFIEEKIKDETYRFCCDDCASKFERDKEHV